jgi:hypothetical protein
VHGSSPDAAAPEGQTYASRSRRLRYDVREHQPTGAVSAPSRAAAARPPAHTIRRGAARAWWPIQSSKLAGPGSPRLGRFDSFAASWLEIGVLAAY